MRRPFSDITRLKKRAKKPRESLEDALQSWFCGKYKLPPHHELFLGRSIAEHLLEYYQDHAEKKEELTNSLKQTGMDTQERARILEVISQIDKMLGNISESSSGDPLVDLWEMQVKAGIEPDLDLTVEDLKKGKGILRGKR